MAAKKQNNFLLPLLLGGGALAAFFIYRQSSTGGGFTMPSFNPGQQSQPGYNEESDLTIAADGTQPKATVLEKVNAGVSLIQTARDVLTDINLPGGGKLRIRKGNRKTAPTVDNFDVTQEDAGEVLNSIKTGNPLTMSKTIAKVAAKSAKKGKIKKNGQGSRAVKTIAKKVKARPVKAKKNIRRKPGSRPVITQKHFY